jgi:methyl-accepting chemotaxis protein
MPFAPLGFFVARYDGQSLQIRKKSRILAAMALGFGGISVVFAALMALTGAGTVSVIFVGIALFCTCVMLLLRGGRYHLASSLFLYGIFAAMFAAIKFDAYVDVYETYVFSTLGCFLLVVTSLVADRPRQAIAIMVLSLLGIEALYWLDAFPKDKGVVTMLAIQNLSVSSLMVAISGFGSAYLVRMTSGLVEEVTRRADAASDSYAKLNSAMNSAQSASQTVGERLSASVAHSMTSLESLKTRVLEISRGMERLTEALELSDSANAGAVSSQDSVNEALSSYSEEVARASSAIEEMAAAAGNIGSQASQKKEAVHALVELSRAGEALLSSMSQSMDNIFESSKKMAEVNVFMGDVAERTNLLGMNASIEAAHAGVSGRGFAVVAGQIRALSVEAGNSSRVISESLKEMQGAVQTAAAKNGEAMSFFKKIADEIHGVSLMLEELLGNIQELSAGSSDVIGAVEKVAELTRGTESAVREARENIGKSSEGIEAVADIAAKVRTDAIDMAGSFDALRKDSGELEGLGRDNLGTIRELKEHLKGFAAAD